MPQTQEIAQAATPAERKCVSCGDHFPTGGRGLGKNFCSDKCRTGFHARMKSEGGPLASLIKAQTLTRHAKPGTREAEICRFARSQITQIAAYLNERDEEEGRASAVDYVGSLMDSGTIWMDRIR